jgi:hypothetical protein
MSIWKCKVCNLEAGSPNGLGDHYADSPDHRPVRVEVGGPPDNPARRKANVLTHQMYYLLEEHLKALNKNNYPYHLTDIEKFTVEVDADLGEKIRDQFKTDVRITRCHVRRALNQYLDGPSPKFKRTQHLQRGKSKPALVDRSTLSCQAERTLGERLTRIELNQDRLKKKFDLILDELLGGKTKGNG